VLDRPTKLRDECIEFVNGLEVLRVLRKVEPSHSEIKTMRVAPLQAKNPAPFTIAFIPSRDFIAQGLVDRAVVSAEEL
jgi:hypothetical protein